MRAMRATSNTPGMNAFCSKQEKKKTCNFQNPYMNRELC